MKKPFVIFLILVLVICASYFAEWATSQPIPTSYDPTAIHWLTSHAEGDILYNNGNSGASSWVVLTKGTKDQVLKMNTGATAPIWGTDTTGGNVSDEAYGATWNGVTATATSKNAIYDYWVNFDADSDGSFLDETWLTTWPGNASITTIGTITTGTVPLGTNTSGNYVEQFRSERIHQVIM
jgi:hypothetical protein